RRRRDRPSRTRFPASRALPRSAARAGLRAQDSRGPSTSLARVEHAMVESVGTAIPELDSQRLDSEAAPEARARHVLRETLVELRKPCRELLAPPGQLGALARRPGADLRIPGAAHPIGVRFRVGHEPRPALHPHLFG